MEGMFVWIVAFAGGDLCALLFLEFVIDSEKRT
jgi:hypothetical protein